MIDVHDVFVSHSHADTDVVKELVREWERWSHTVYADFKDEQLLEASRKNIMNVELVNRLLETIRRCRLFVFIASENSATSNWMPWELGLAHGAVGRVHLYMLNPAAKAAFIQREYLELYRETTFDAKTAPDYLERAVDQARHQPANPAQIKAAFEMGERAMRALLESRSPEFYKELSASPAMQGLATSEGFTQFSLQPSSGKKTP